MALTTYAGTAETPGETMRVRLAGQLDLAPIYADPLLTPKANPFITDPSTGAFTFWADDADTYDIEPNTPEED
jgi:hypothetical protein